MNPDEGGLTMSDETDWRVRVGELLEVLDLGVAAWWSDIVGSVRAKVRAADRYRLLRKGLVDALEVEDEDQPWPVLVELVRELRRGAEVEITYHGRRHYTLDVSWED